MKFVALVSGGKDSIYAIQLLKEAGHTPVALLYMKNNDSYVDSYMYQTVGSEVVQLFGKCMDLPFYTYPTKCVTKNVELDYGITEQDEVEDMYHALRDIKHQIEFDAVSSGAILSRYQKNRVENVAARLSLIALAPLWNQNQAKLLNDMIASNVKAVLVKIACPLLDKSLLGKNIREMKNIDMGTDGNYCGEGGEYETVVLDCDLFTKKIEYSNIIHCHPDEQFDTATVFYLQFSDVHLIDK